MTTPPLDLTETRSRVESIPPNGESAMKGMAFPAAALPELWTLRHIARVDAPALLDRVEELEAEVVRWRLATIGAGNQGHAAEVKIADVRELHTKTYVSVESQIWGRDPRCSECHDAYPCPTIRALDHHTPETEES